MTDSSSSNADEAAASRRQLLPAPERRPGRCSFDWLLQRRHSHRGFEADSLTEQQIAELLWAAGGTTEAHTEQGFVRHTIPSAGAIYPLEFYFLDARGMAHYDPAWHALEWLTSDDLRAPLAQAALNQSCVREAPAILVIAAEPARTRAKYGERGDRYVMIEAGCACQNVLLQATELQLGAVPVGAFDDEAAARALRLPEERGVLLLIPLGQPQ